MVERRRRFGETWALREASSHAPPGSGFAVTGGGGGERLADEHRYFQYLELFARVQLLVLVATAHVPGPSRLD